MNSTLEHQIAKYADHLGDLTAPVSESEIISRASRTAPRIRNGLIAAAAAVVVIIVVGAAAILTQFGGHEGPLTTPAPTSPPTTSPIETSTTLPTPPEAVFSWSEDDLAGWVTEDEMTDALADLLGVEIDGRATVDLEADDWVWTVGGWTVIAHDGDHSPSGGVVDPTRTDPRLPHGVTYEALSGFAHGFYGLSGPESDESICLTLFPPDSKFGYPAGLEAEAHQDRVFALASMMLQEMGWAD